MNFKPILRKLILDCRRLLADDEFQKRNKHLCNQTLTLIREKDYKAIHIFLPIARNREVDLTSLFKPLWEDGRRIMVSKTDFKSKIMNHFWLESGTELVETKFGIPEPNNASPAQITDADLILVPLLIADHSGNRIGYGGGFYDKLLASFSGHSVGVCLSTLVDDLGTEEWDVPVRQMIFYHPS